MPLKHLLSVTDFSESEFLEIIENCLLKDEGIAMTLAERLIEKGLEQGLEQGREEGQQEIARRMLFAGMNLNTIQEITALSEKTLLALIKKTRN